MNQINNSNNILYQDSIPFFTTILDLKAYVNYSQGDVVEVGGRTSIGDGYGSKFIYDETSTAFVDDENVVIPSNLPLNSSGRWLINGWSFLNDKMDADNKILNGMTISSSTLTGSTITNSTLSGVSTEPTTDWTANTIVGALDVNNKINDGLSLKANLGTDNAFTGNQSITGNLSVVGSNTTNGTFQVLGKGNAPTNSKVVLSRSTNYSIVQSYDGSKWHFLSINDDGTVDTEKGNLAFQSDVDTKANLAGGNTLTGDQTISGSNLVVSQTDKSATTIMKSLDTTTPGGILRYTDSSSTNHDWVFGTNTITTPTGNTISDAGDLTKIYVSFAGDNTITGSLSVPDVTDFTTQEALNAVTADKRYVRNNAGTKGGIVAIDLDSDGTGDLAFERADGSWGLCQAQGNYALVSQLPLSDTSLKMQVFRVTVVFDGKDAYSITFPQAFKAGTTPYVFIPSSQEINGALWYSVIGIAEANGGLSITNTGFQVVKIGWGGGTQFYGNSGTVIVDILAIGEY